jgi:DNA uptake protein ComE-like DNA-binding protein
MAAGPDGARRFAYRPPKVDERTERIAFTLALVACLMLVVGAGWGRWRPAQVELIAVRDDVTVHVGGQVAAPGSYRLPWGSRVGDLIALAGGPLDDAEPSLVAWAAPLTDGASVVVPRRNDADGDDRVDVNAAGERLLATLPGVGPVTAARIVAGRPYHAVDDLLRVPGIGAARLEALRPWITLGGGQ